MANVTNLLLFGGNKRQKLFQKCRKINKIIYLVIDNFLHSECSILKATLILLHLIGKQSHKALEFPSIITKTISLY